MCGVCESHMNFTLYLHIKLHLAANFVKSGSKNLCKYVDKVGKTISSTNEAVTVPVEHAQCGLTDWCCHSQHVMDPFL